MPSIDKAWLQTPSAERSQCIGTVAVGGSPSYVELVVCLEMMRDLRAHREEQRTKNAQKLTSKSPTSSQAKSLTVLTLCRSHCVASFFFLNRMSNFAQTPLALYTHHIFLIN